jgi:hypothetical protein
MSPSLLECGFNILIGYADALADNSCGFLKQSLPSGLIKVIVNGGSERLIPQDRTMIFIPLTTSDSILVKAMAPPVSFPADIGDNIVLNFE